MFKKFVLLVTCFLILFGLYHLTIWHFFTSKIYDTAPYQIGDLARMSYQLGSIHRRIDENSLDKHHISYDKYKEGMQIDIITIGDSFSNGGGVGLNPFYQDYIATLSNKSVLNIQNPDEEINYLEAINALIDNGWVDKVNPSIIIIQTVARRLAKLYAREQRWDIILSDNFESRLYNRPWREDIKTPKIINTANYKLPLYSILYKFKPNAQKNVVKLPLTQELFSVKNASTLLIYKEDIENMEQFNKEFVSLINDNFNTLAKKLQHKGVKLIFMPAVDKYDLYSEFILNNPYPPNPLFENLRDLDKNYTLLDTKAILKQAVFNGEIDIFYADDTHWSYKASKLIADEFEKLLR